MYVQFNIKVRSFKNCCSGKAISITYYECVLVALDIQNAMRMRHIVICDLSGSIVFFHIISQTAGLSKKLIKHKMCFNFLYIFSKRFSF